MLEYIKESIQLSARYEEDPKILVDVFTLDNTTTFKINETVEVVSVVRHDLNSQGEAFPGRIRVFTPNYLVCTGRSLTYFGQIVSFDIV